MAGKSVGNLYVQLSADSRQLTAEVNAVPASVRRMVGEVNSTRVSLPKPETSGYAQFMKGAAGTVASVAAGAGLAVLTKDAVKATIEAEKTRIAFEAMTGSAKQATDLMRETRQFARNSPFDANEIGLFSRRMLGAGVATAQVVPYVRMLADVTAGIGGDFGLVAMAYTQALGKGKLMAEELNGQFGGQGMGASFFAGALGLDTQKFIQMVKDGKVGSDMLTQAFINLTKEGGRFHGMSEKLAAADPFAQLSKSVSELAMNVAKLALKQTDAAAGAGGLAGVMKDLNEAFEVGGGERHAGRRPDGVRPGHRGRQGLGRSVWRGLDGLTGIGPAVKELERVKAVEQELNKMRKENRADFIKNMKPPMPPAPPVPPKVFTVPDEVKAFVDDLKRFTPLEIARTVMWNEKGTHHGQPFEAFKDTGVGEYSQFRRMQAIGRFATHFGQAKPFEADMALASQFLQLEKGLGLGKPVYNPPPLLEVGSQAGEQYANKVAAEAADAPKNADDRIRMVLERAKEIEQQQLKELKKLAAALQKIDIKPVSIK